MDWDPFNKAVNLVKSYIQLYNSPANKAVRNSPYYRLQQQLKALMQGKLQGVTDPVQRSSILSLYRQRIGGALLRAKSMGYSPSGNYNQNNLLKYYGLNGSNVQLLATKNDQNFIKNIGQSMAGATGKAAINLVYAPLDIANLGYMGATGLYNYAKGNGFTPDYRWANNIQNRKNQLGYSTYDLLQGPMSDKLKAVQEFVAGTALTFGAGAAVKALGPTTTPTLLGTQASKLAQQTAARAGTQGAQTVANPSTLLKWREFRQHAGLLRQQDSLVRKTINDLVKENRGVRASDKGLLGKTFDIVKHPILATRLAWLHGKWADRFAHPLKNTRLWWRYSDTANAIRNPGKTVSGMVGNPQDAVKFVRLGKGALDKAKRIGAISYDAGKNATKWGVDAAASLGARISLDDTLLSWKQSIYADNTLTDLQKVNRLNAILFAKRGIKTGLGIAAVKHGFTPMSRLVGATTAMLGGVAPVVLSLMQAPAAAALGSSFFGAFMPYATLGNENTYQRAKRYGTRFGNTLRFRNYLQRAGGDLAQALLYSKIGAIPGFFGLAALGLKYGGTVSPAILDRSGTLQMAYNTLLLAQQTAAINRQLKLINSNKHLTALLKAQATQKLQLMKLTVLNRVGNIGLLTNKGSAANAISSYFKNQPIKPLDQYALLNIGRLSLPFRMLLNPIVDKQISDNIQARKVLSNQLANTTDPALRQKIIGRLSELQNNMNPLVALSAVNMRNDPSYSIAKAMGKAGINSGDIRNMALAHNYLKAPADKATYAAMQQMGVNGALKHYTNLVSKAASSGNTEEFMKLSKDALYLMNQMGLGATDSELGKQLKQAFQKNMVTMMQKDPSLIPVAVGLFLGGKGMPGLGGFVALNPIVALGGVAALFALPTIIGGMKDLISSRGQQMLAQAPQSQVLPLTDLYATTLRRG